MITKLTSKTDEAYLSLPISTLSLRVRSVILSEESDNLVSLFRPEPNQKAACFRQFLSISKIQKNKEDDPESKMK